MGKRKRSERDDTDVVESLLKEVKKLVKNRDNVRKRRRILSSSSTESGTRVSSPNCSTYQDLASDLEIQGEYKRKNVNSL